LFVHNIQWPFAVLDFEASALTEYSYPIEIGIAIWRTPQSPIETWSSLIAPDLDWIINGDWFEAAQNVHGIKTHDLIGATRPGEIVKTLRTILSGINSVISNNPYWERLWLEKLIKASNESYNIEIDAWLDRISKLNPNQRHKMFEYGKTVKIPHRAEADAELLIRILAKGLGMEPLTEKLRVAQYDARTDQDHS
jgi:hypothetical protein